MVDGGFAICDLRFTRHLLILPHRKSKLHRHESGGEEFLSEVAIGACTRTVIGA